jgi:PDZ domain-containing protein
MRRSLGVLLVSIVVAFLLAAGVMVWATSAQSDDFAFVPQAATPVADVLVVEDAPPPPPGAGRVYYSSVGIRHATMFESWFGVDDGGRLVSEEEFLGPHGSEETENRIMDLTMDASQANALLVAARALGLPAELESDGNLVILVDPEGPYAEAGGEFGDVIVAIDGAPATTLEEAKAIITGKPVGSTFAVDVIREDEPLTLTATTVMGPDDAPIIGVGLRPDYRVETPLEVEFSVENVGGPSAGLAFALQIYRAEKDFANLGGLRIAATGAIEEDGAVTSVGGVTQKAIGAGRVNADLFLVPEDNLEEARAQAPDGVEVIGVGSFDEALEAIAERAGTAVAR